MSLEGSTTTAVRRRGRPYRLPEDPYPLTHELLGVDQRVAWLLGLSRVHGADVVGSTREDFIALLTARGLRADQSRISRWESGRQSVPLGVVATYESILGLPEGQLTTAVAGLRHSVSGHHRWPADQVPAARTGLDNGDCEPTTGESWLRLARSLPEPGTTPRGPAPSLAGDWAERSHRLVHELCRSVGLAHLRRFEAARLLIKHPRTQHHVVRALGHLATDRDVQYVMDPLCLLHEVRDRRAGDLLVRLLDQGLPAHRRGAVWGITRRIGHGLYDGPDLDRLAELTARLLRESPGTGDHSVLSLYAHLPTATRVRLLAGSDSEARARLEHAHRHRELVAPEEASATVTRLTSMVASETEATPEPDPMLARLLREALFHVDPERQHHAIAFLGVSPYRPAVAQALVSLLDRAGEQVAVRALSVLSPLVTARQQPDLRRWALGEQRLAIRALAMRSLGHLPGPLPHEDEASLVRLLRRPTAGTLERATLYALGMTRARALAQVEDLGGEVGSLASWWQTHGGTVRDLSA